MKNSTKKFVVTAENCANRVGSGNLEVLATPTMIAWMENVAMLLAAEDLNEGDTTVGVAIDVEHLKASKISEEITATATLVERDGRLLIFEIECIDSTQSIVGKAKHKRFIVDREKFLAKL